MDIEQYVDELTEKALGRGPSSQPTEASEPLEVVLKGRAVELWPTAAGRLFLVADEDDPRRTITRFGAQRGEIYTAAEARRIIAVNDPAAVAEIHDWKRQFDGKIGGHQPRKAGWND